MNNPKFIANLYKKFSKFINNLLEKNLNKLNVDNFKNLLINNKIFLSIVALIILFLSYLSFPNIHNKEDIALEIKKNLKNKLNLEFNFQEDLDYKFLPRPHFTTNNSSINSQEDKITEIKKLTVYVSLENLFSLKNIKLNQVILEEANFNLNKENYNFFYNLLDSNFNDFKFEIFKSNVFYRSLENEVLFINNIKNAEYFFDPKEIKNMLYANNEIFNLPYSIKVFDDKIDKTIHSKINIESLRLEIENQTSYDDSNYLGFSEINLINAKSLFEYQLKDNLFEFKLFDKLQNPEFSYIGKFNFKPFYSNITGNTNKLNFSSLFSSNTIIKELLKTEILNNKNIDFYLIISGNSIKQFNDFKNVLIKSKIQEGLVDIDQSKMTWKNNIDFEFLDSLVFVKEGKLILDSNVEININNTDELYKFLLTPKNLRKKISKVNVNFTYFFDEKNIKVKNIKIDGKSLEKSKYSFDDILLKENNLQNKIYLKNLLNELIKNYVG
ncbi:AsmA family protein [Candidatus Pelagibacter sp. HIMB1746]|uniref:AsmA family protein n=1 Tax=Candidatus Pelagibacter sp. HIMB1746 TaxID=3413370 RepID=UPI003F8718F9